MTSILIQLLSMMALALLFGLLVVFVSRKFTVTGNPVVDQINQILPQTQCGQCNYPGCKPYAEAIAMGDAPINQCPPGGETGIRQLADLLDIDILELNSDNGSEESDQIVEIVEPECIGCTKCIQVCPVDAILGASKKMHTVIADECTGCDLCIPVCPVDCIVKIPTPTLTSRMAKPALFESVYQAQQW